MTKLHLADTLALPLAVEEPRFGMTRRWKGKRLLTKAEKLERQRVRTRKWRARNRQKMLEYFRRYRSAHPELKQYHGEYFRKNRAKWVARAKSEAAKAWRREHSRKNRARLNAARRAWDRRNPDRARAIAARHVERRRPLKREADRLYRQQKPDIYNAGIARAKAKKPELYKAISVQSSLRRRVRQRALPVEPVSRHRIHARDRDRCHLCLKPIDGRATFDHLIPVVRGGAHAEWNLMLAHDHCNKSRGTKQILPVETKEAALAYVSRRIAEVAA